MAKADKRQMWARRIAACERSGMSRRAWCAAQGVNVHTLAYWRYRLRQPAVAAARKARSKALVPIMVKAPSNAAAAMIEIALTSGVTLRAPVSAEAAWLAQVVRELARC